jgi:hypothetical protein
MGRESLLSIRFLEHRREAQLTRISRDRPLGPLRRVGEVGRLPALAAGGVARKDRLDGRDDRQQTMITVAQAIALKAKLFTYVPMSRGRLMSRSIRTSTTGSRTPLSTCE